jgi:hypothetical protein
MKKIVNKMEAIVLLSLIIFLFLGLFMDDIKWFVSSWKNFDHLFSILGSIASVIAIAIAINSYRLSRIALQKSDQEKIDAIQPRLEIKTADSFLMNSYPYYFSKETTRFATLDWMMQTVEINNIGLNHAVNLNYFFEYNEQKVKSDIVDILKKIRNSDLPSEVVDYFCNEINSYKSNEIHDRPLSTWLDETDEYLKVEGKRKIDFPPEFSQIMSIYLIPYLLGLKRFSLPTFNFVIRYEDLMDNARTVGFSFRYGFKRDDLDYLDILDFFPDKSSKIRYSPEFEVLLLRIEAHYLRKQIQ